MSGKYRNPGQVTTRSTISVTSLGHGLELIRKKKINFTHEMACWLLEEAQEFAGDRKLRSGHVDYLVGTMQRGTFHPEWVTLITCKLDDKVHRMNGQHTAWARLEMPADWPCEVTLLEYKAENEEDLRTLYASVDRSSPRTRANVIDSYLVGTPEFKGIKDRTLRLVAQGFSMWYWKAKTERQKHDGDDVAFLIKTECYDLVIKVCSFLDKQSPREQRHVFRAPVVAAMLATFDKAPQIALQFWGPVADGTGIDQRSDPRLKLRNELMQTAVSLGGGAQSDKKQASGEVMYRNCVLAWNAFREGRTLQVLRGNERGARPTIRK